MCLFVVRKSILDKAAMTKAQMRPSQKLSKGDSYELNSGKHPEDESKQDNVCCNGYLYSPKILIKHPDFEYE